MAKRLGLLVPMTALTVGACLVVHAADAQPALVDPTRPPNVAPAGARDGSAQPGAAAAPRLESTLISPNRKLAVIDGQTVTVGSKVDEATVVQIAETRVTLRQGAELKTLELYPGIERKPAKSEKTRGNSR